MNSLLIKIFTGSLALCIVAVSAVPVTENTSNNGVSSFYDFIMCGLDKSPLTCAKTKIGRVLDIWDAELQEYTKSWGEEADKEVKDSGRQLDSQETPSHAAHKVLLALNELATILQKSLYKTLLQRENKTPENEDNEDIITSEIVEDDMKKDKKKRKKTHSGNAFIKRGEEVDMEVVSVAHKQDGAMIQVGENMSVDKELAGPAKLRVKRENETVEGRGKKKKQKKAILKLLLLGAILKAKLGLLLQLLMAHLQVKFFAIALAGLALNIARFWLDLKKGHSPQKVIYYEHAQHQHHYEHEDEGGWGGYWSRSLDTKKDKKDPDNSGDTGDDLAYGGWVYRKK